jgi:hypothetical protein
MCISVAFKHCGRARSSEREVRRCFGSAMSDPQLVSSLPLTATSSLLMSNDPVGIKRPVSEVVSSAGIQRPWVNVPLEESSEG